MDHRQGSWRVRGPFREGGSRALGWVGGGQGGEGRGFFLMWFDMIWFGVGNLGDFKNRY